MDWGIVLAFNTYLLGPALGFFLFYGIGLFAWTGEHWQVPALAALLLVVWVPTQVILGVLSRE